MARLNILALLKKFFKGTNLTSKKVILFFSLALVYLLLDAQNKREDFLFFYKKYFFGINLLIER